MAICLIAANADVSGIGVRTSVYVQALLFLASTLLHTNLDAHEVDNILSRLVQEGLASLLTGLAILVSAIVQARTVGLTVYHALVILNMSWITIVIAIVPYSVSLALILPHINMASAKEQLDRMFLVHVAHFSLTAIFGLWVFYDLKSFDTTPRNCTSSMVFYFGRYFHVFDVPFQRLWKGIYFLAIIPILNAAILTIALSPILFLSAFIMRMYEAAQGRMKTPCPTPVPSLLPPSHKPPIAQQIGILLAASIVTTLLIVSTEKTIKANSVAPGENQWTLGQTFALLLTIPRVLEVVIVGRLRIRRLFRKPIIDITLV
ncbi:hypothetical protein BS47DRAFT_1349376 [Hydnum rufescens UP504]|uniref:Uncharacterized protein n=1 Tax=Hydnum rufescens UP504 TaxID=1448309 RepID=A0A9P6DSB6_9AGAM|nr:hypothetical protein BS47DRAFT_1349376 [Hydnum rufescens UP504]